MVPAVSYMYACGQFDTLSGSQVAMVSYDVLCSTWSEFFIVECAVRSGFD